MITLVAVAVGLILDCVGTGCAVRLVSGVAVMPSPVDPGCVVGAESRKIWVDTSNPAATNVKVCKKSGAVLSWVLLSTLPVESVVAGVPKCHGIFRRRCK